MREQLRIPQYFKQQEEQLFLALEVALEALPENGGNQIPNLVGVPRVCHENSIRLVHHEEAEHGADSQSCTQIEGKEGGISEE